jgi:hypothetical protein
MLKRTHELLMEIERMKREHIEAIANRNGVWAQETQSTVRSQQKTIASLQETHGEAGVGAESCFVAWSGREWSATNLSSLASCSLMYM